MIVDFFIPKILVPKMTAAETVAYALLESLHDVIVKSARRSAKRTPARKAPAKPTAKPAEALAVVVQQPPANDTTPALRPTGTADH